MRLMQAYVISAAFAIKFYTEEGNWDVAETIHLSSARDAHNFPDLNRAVKRDPEQAMRSAQNNWDFWSMLPASFIRQPLPCLTEIVRLLTDTCMVLAHILSVS